MLGLPARIRACLFDLDGVLTDTAGLHAASWKATFDAFLRQRAAATGEAFVAFDARSDYAAYVDGRPREDGVRTFLAERGIALPEGGPGDAPGAETVAGLAAAKNELVRRAVDAGGVAAYPGSLAYLRAARAAGLSRAVVSSSANCRRVLASAGLGGLLEAVVDADLADRERLAGKPAPDTYLAGARLLAVAPEEAAVFEDALAGVEAGRAGGFGFVVGLDREDQADALVAHGADLVVADLSELLDAP